MKECEYCKTDNEKCGTCTQFYEDCSAYSSEEICIEYKPVKYCFNCGRKLNEVTENE
jgi:hypothetical protein